MFRVLVVVCLAAIGYGVLYSALPCWAQLGTKSVLCQIQAANEQEQLRIAEWRKTHPHGTEFQYSVDEQRRILEGELREALRKGR